MDINISFVDPIEVSQDIEADYILLSLNGFDIFEDENGISLPKSLVKKILLPAQYASYEEGVSVDNISTGAKTMNSSILGSNFVVNLLLVGSMSQVWGAINGLQLMVFMPLFWLKFPANANGMNSSLIDIASFDLLPSDDIN